MSSRRDRLAVALLSIGLLLYNSVVSLYRLPETWSFLANIALGLSLLAFARLISLSWEDAGLRSEGMLRSLGLGISLGAAAFAVALFFAANSKGSQFGAADAATYEGWRLVAKLLIHVPIGTALVEEFAFRGVLLGTWSRVVGWWPAALGSSLIFSMWHIPSTLGHYPMETWLSRSTLIQVLQAMGGTLALGLVLCYLRRRTGAIWAGVPFHSGFNSGGVIGVLLRRG